MITAQTSTSIGAEQALSTRQLDAGQCLVWVDAVEKRILQKNLSNIDSPIILTRNLDSKICPSRFVCFKFQFHSAFSETFSTASVKSGPNADVRVESDLAPIADVGRAGAMEARG
jgi:hypothetical protein